MKVLNEDYLKKILDNKEDFLSIEPFPFINEKGIFKSGVRDKLRDTFPDLTKYQSRQDSTQKYSISDISKADLDFSDIWKDFLSDLDSDTYRNFLKELLDIDVDIDLHSEWTVRDEEGFLGPHTDTIAKKCTHLFYFCNDWKVKYGGRTGILYDYNGPNDAFSKKLPEQSWGKILYADMNEESLFFKVSNKSFHFTEPIIKDLPIGAKRRVFFINPVEKS